MGQSLLMKSPFSLKCFLQGFRHMRTSHLHHGLVKSSTCAQPRLANSPTFHILSGNFPTTEIILFI